MSLINSIILGIIQGLAEFLPVSSSGHLAFFEEVLGIQQAGMVFDVMLHLGTLAAVFIAFWKDIKKLFVEGICIIAGLFINLIRLIRNIGRKDRVEYIHIISSAYRKFVFLIIISTIPTGIIGYLLKDLVGSASSSLLIVGICFIITATMLLVADNVPGGHRRARQVSYSQAGIVGVVQGFATFPGISRSGSTITACLLCGFDKRFAVKYSFIMSIPAVIGAVILELKDFTSIDMSSRDIINYGVGTLVAAVIGYICIKTMMVIIKKNKFKYFAYYCYAIGVVSIIWYIV